MIEMKTTPTLRYCRFIITCLVCFFISFSPLTDSYALEQKNRVEVSSFEELGSSLEQLKSTGGTIVLTRDITVPAEESYLYNNGTYQKEIVIQTEGHTIYVDGYLELWPFLTISGNGSQQELLNVRPGGELWLTSICLDAGENGVAVVQEEGSFLMYGSEESLDLPSFTCKGQIICPKTMTAAAYWHYDCEELPVVIVPDGEDFTADMLPDKVRASINREHQLIEEEIPVLWDKDSLPSEQERTIVQGRFGDGYSQYKDCMPKCLVVFESDTAPFFLNVYLKSLTKGYEMVFMYGKSPKQGTVYVQSSEDGQIWSDITGTDGYTPVQTEANKSFMWLLSYDESDHARKRPRYYRMVQILDDGTNVYSEPLELSDDLIFTSADIEGGRGGETNPNEGENQISDGIQKPENDNEDSLWETQPESSQSKTSQSKTDAEAVHLEESEKNRSESVTDKEPTSAEADDEYDELSDHAETDVANSHAAANEKKIGILAVIFILLGSVVFSILKRKR